MDVPESHAHLLEARFATLGTIDSAGRPQLTMLWFLHHEGEIKVWLNDARWKTRNLRARPACSILILDLENPQRYLEIRGHAVLTPDPEYAFGSLFKAKYGVDLSGMEDPPGQSRLIITVKAERVHAVDNS
jgi:PPOX class probable F420-dependent enzyme